MSGRTLTFRRDIDGRIKKKVIVALLEVRYIKLIASQILLQIPYRPCIFSVGRLSNRTFKFGHRYPIKYVFQYLEIDSFIFERKSEVICGGISWPILIQINSEFASVFNYVF